METKKIQYNQEVRLIDEQIASEDNTFVNREFMRYYPVKQAITNINQIPSSPKNFFEQIQLFDDGVNKKLFIYINGLWEEFTPVI